MTRRWNSGMSAATVTVRTDTTGGNATQHRDADLAQARVVVTNGHLGGVSQHRRRTISTTRVIDYPRCQRAVMLRVDISIMSLSRWSAGAASQCHSRRLGHVNSVGRVQHRACAACRHAAMTSMAFVDMADSDTPRRHDTAAMSAR